MESTLAFAPKQPKVSIVVPLYNTASYLPACLDSISAQTFTDFELLLIDDGSTDDSAAIAERYAQRDDRIRLIRRRWNRGAAEARNLGIELSQGKYLTFIDSDDLVTPNYLSSLYQAARTLNAEVTVAGFQDFTAAPGDGQAFRWTEKTKLLPATLDSRIAAFLWVHVPIGPWNKLYQRDYLNQHKILFHSMPIAEDVGFHFCCLMTASRYAVIPQTIYHYRHGRENSVSSVKDTRRIDYWAVMAARTLNYVDEWAQGETSLSGPETRNWLCWCLYQHWRIQLKNMSQSYGRDIVFSHTQAALAHEPHEPLLRTMLFDILYHENA